MPKVRYKSRLIIVAMSELEILKAWLSRKAITSPSTSPISHSIKSLVGILEIFFSERAIPLEINSAKLSLKIKKTTPGIMAAAPKITPTPVSVIISASFISRYLSIKSNRKNISPIPQAAPSGKDIILNSLFNIQ